MKLRGRVHGEDSPSPRRCSCASTSGGGSAGAVAHDDRLIGIVETSRWGRPSASLILYAGHPPTAGTIRGLGHACVGRFWQGVALRLIERGEAPEVESLGAESGVFFASGGQQPIEALAEALMPYLTDAEAVTALVREADAVGFDFHDDCGP